MDISYKVFVIMTHTVVFVGSFWECIMYRDTHGKKFLQVE